MQYRGFELDRFQRRAIEHIDADHSVIVAAPTGTGKTLIADYLIEEVLAEGREVIYTSPVKALSNQKYRQYTRLFGEDAIGLVTGDLVINRNAPIRIMTTEILRNILLEGRASHRGEARVDEEEDERTISTSDVTIPDLENLEAVIVDEIHFLDDPYRGTVWEELLIYLPPSIRILGLSATLSNLEEFADWLSSIRGQQVQVVRENQRAVPLEVQIFNVDTGLVRPDEFQRAHADWRRQERRSSRRRGRKKKGVNTSHFDIVRDLPNHYFPALYFIFSRKLTEIFAGKMARSQLGRSLGVDGQMRGAIRTKLDEFEREYPDVLARHLRTMYERGIAYHHAGLHVALKALVEELYESGLIRLLYCTSTFALGINMPARTVVFDSLDKYNGEEIAPLTTREFMQMAGRAGRRGIDNRGDVIVRQDFHDFEDVRGLLQTVLRGESEPVTSSFNLSFHSVVNLLDRFEEEAIREMLERSFRAYRSQLAAEDLRSEIADRERALTDQTEVYTDAEREPSPKERRRLRKHRRRVASLRRSLAEEERPRMWEDFQRKVTFLRTYGYIDEHDELQLPARILEHFKFQEVFMTELYLDGLFEDLGPEKTFGVACALVQTFPRSVRFNRLPKDWRPIVDRVTSIYESEVVRASAEVSQTETVFTPEMLSLGERWALGDSLGSITDDISSRIDIAGDLVGAFRRGKDLCGQLRLVYNEDPYKRKELRELLRTVTRDEVVVID